MDGCVDWWTESEAQPGGYYQHIYNMDKVILSQCTAFWWILSAHIQHGQGNLESGAQPPGGYYQHIYNMDKVILSQVHSLLVDTIST